MVSSSATRTLPDPRCGLDITVRASTGESTRAIGRNTRKRLPNPSSESTSTNPW